MVWSQRANFSGMLDNKKDMYSSMRIKSKRSTKSQFLWVPIVIMQIIFSAGNIAAIAGLKFVRSGETLIEKISKKSCTAL